MKPALALALFTITANAQNFVALKITAAAPVASFKVPTNTLATLCGYVGTPANVFVTNGTFEPAYLVTVPTFPNPLPQALLGPCDVALCKSGQVTTNYFGQLVIELRPVNIAEPGPSQSAAVFSVETSTNLTTWQTITNASYPAKEPRRFFRTSLKMP